MLISSAMLEVELRGSEPRAQTIRSKILLCRWLSLDTKAPSGKHSPHGDAGTQVCRTSERQTSAEVPKRCPDQSHRRKRGRQAHASVAFVHTQLRMNIGVSTGCWR